MKKPLPLKLPKIKTIPVKKLAQKPVAKPIIKPLINKLAPKPKTLQLPKLPVKPAMPKKLIKTT